MLLKCRMRKASFVAAGITADRLANLAKVFSALNAVFPLARIQRHSACCASDEHDQQDRYDEVWQRECTATTGWNIFASATSGEQENRPTKPDSRRRCCR